MFVRAYPRETQEMVFDAHERGFAFFKGACRRGIYDNLWTSPAQGDLLVSAHGMHESIRPVAGLFAPLALMGVRCFWPHNMIGHADRAAQFGWLREQIVVIDDDLGRSGASVEGRLGFQRLVAEVGLGKVGLVLGVEMSRLARSCRDWISFWRSARCSTR